MYEYIRLHTIEYKGYTSSAAQAHAVGTGDVANKQASLGLQRCAGLSAEFGMRAETAAMTQRLVVGSETLTSVEDLAICSATLTTSTNPKRKACAFGTAPTALIALRHCHPNPVPFDEEPCAGTAAVHGCCVFCMQGQHAGGGLPGGNVTRRNTHFNDTKLSTQHADRHRKRGYPGPMNGLSR